MDNNTVRQFAQALQMFDTDVTAKEAEERVLSVLNQLDDKEILAYEEAAKKIATLQEAEDNVKKSVKELFAELFPSLSFYPALGIWGLVDKMIQSGTISGLDTADRDKLLVYSALFFGLVGGKIAYNRIKEKVNEIKSADAQISEVLKKAGVQLDEKKENWDWYYGDEKLGSTEIERDEKTGEGKPVKQDWILKNGEVRKGVQKIASKFGLSNHEAMIKYAEENGIDFGDVYDYYVYGDEELSLEDAKKQLAATEEEFYREQNADDFLYSNGGWERYSNEIRHLKNVIRKLENKQVNEEVNPDSQLENAVKFVYNGMKEKFGRPYAEEEDEDDYKQELCHKAAEKFNVSIEEISDKIASDYVDTMPYVTKDNDGNYSEIPDDVHEIVSSIYN